MLDVRRFRGSRCVSTSGTDDQRWNDPRRSTTVAEMAGGTEGTSRVADVLLLFTDGPSTLGVTRIARELGLSKAVVHRILQSLTARGMIAYEPSSREYRLGPAIAALGARALRESDLRSAALEVLRGLRDAT